MDRDAEDAMHMKLVMQMFTPLEGTEEEIQASLLASYDTFKRHLRALRDAQPRPKPTRYELLLAARDIPVPASRGKC